LEVLTAETIWAPFLMMAECSALEPTMKPVTLCRKIIGTFLGWVSKWKQYYKPCIWCSQLVALANELSPLRGFVAVYDGDSVSDDTNGVSYMGCQ
jgi:hypothetical protein